MVFDIRFGGGVFKLGFIADVCVQHPNPLFFSFFLLILFFPGKKFAATPWGPLDHCQM